MADDISAFLPENLTQFNESLTQRLEGLKMEWHGQYMLKLSLDVTLKAMEGGKWRADKLSVGGAPVNSGNLKTQYQQQLAQVESNMQHLENQIATIAAEQGAVKAKIDARAKESIEAEVA